MITEDQVIQYEIANSEVLYFFSILFPSLAESIMEKRIKRKYKKYKDFYEFTENKIKKHPGEFKGEF